MATQVALLCLCFFLDFCGLYLHALELNMILKSEHISKTPKKDENWVSIRFEIEACTIANIAIGEFAIRIAMQVYVKYFIFVHQLLYENNNVFILYTKFYNKYINHTQLIQHLIIPTPNPLGFGMTIARRIISFFSFSYFKRA